MRHALNQVNWKDLLPSVYGWLDRVEIAPGSSMSGTIVVAADINEKTKAVELDAPDLDAGFRSKVADAVTKAGWTGKTGPLTLVVDGTVCLVAIADHVDVCGSAQRRNRKFGLDVSRSLKDCKDDALTLVGFKDANLTEVFDGLAMGLYELNAFKNPKDRKDTLADFPGKVVLLGAKCDADELSGLKAMAQSVVVTRFVQDAPPNYLDPLKFAEISADLSKTLGLKCTILDKGDLEKLGMHSILSVADGGKTEPRLIFMEATGEDTSKTVALVGKGLTFDSGGTSLKPSAGMDEMKYDMSGGAAVLGAAHFLGKVKPPTNVVCVIGASENMSGANATKPGDIVKAYNGKTIEILNTDAEGRLVLADALAYTAEKYKPDLMVDAATLTGAVLHGLGTIGAAVMTFDQDTANYLIRASEAFGEPLWQLPLWNELKKEVKSDIADLRNIAKPNVKAGTIIGGVFLSEFVGDTKWAHLDIAGTAWSSLAHGYPVSGGTAFGLRAMVAACMNFNK